MASPSVCVSIVHWNGGQSTIKCIESVFANAYANLSLVIIDNGSTDTALLEVAARWPEITIIRNDSNTGFTGGQNQGIAEARKRDAAFVLLLNQDAIVQLGCIPEMVALAEADARIGLISPVVYFDDDPDRVQFSGSWVDQKKLTVIYSRDFDVIRAAEARQPRSMSLWGTALMIRTKMMDEIGVLDERFFAYYEDTDYSMRASSAGWLTRMCFSAAILHEGHPTVYSRPPHFFYLMTRNGFLFWKKTLTRFQYWMRIRIHLSRILHQAANLQDAGKSDQMQASIDGIWDAMHDRYGTLAATRHAPTWFGKMLMARPYLFAGLLNFEFGAIRKEIAARLGKRG